MAATRTTSGDDIDRTHIGGPPQATTHTTVSPAALQDDTVPAITKEDDDGRRPAPGESTAERPKPGGGGSRQPEPDDDDARYWQEEGEEAGDAGEDDDTLLEEDALVLEEDPAEMASWAGQPSVKGSSEVMRMVLLAFNSIGISFTWGIEMTYCTPYLLSLGLTKGQTSLVWIAGPLSGLIVQPLIGVMSDGYTSRWGRRRPFIAVGAVIVAISIITLGFTKEIAGIFISDKETAKIVTIVMAVFALYAVDFSINAVTSCSRSLLVDTLPASKQQAGAAWSGRMASIGHISGYGLGAVNLVGIFGPTFGDTQFKQLTIIAATTMLVSSAINCWAVTERVLISVKHNPNRPRGRFKLVRQIWATLLTLTPRMQAICWAVFWSWIGWFPFLFYSSTWVGETYFRFDLPADAKTSDDALGDMGRVGSAALTVYSAITFVGAWMLPLLVRSPEDEAFTHRPPQSIAHWLERFNKLKPDLLTMWICAHLMFASAMFFAPFAQSFRFATVLVAFCGIPWTITMWAPQTFMGIEVNKMSGGGGADVSTASYRRLSNDSAIELSARSSPTPQQQQQQTEGQQQQPQRPLPRRDTLRLEHGGGDGVVAGPPPSSTGELSGVYFGILNIYTTLPQFISTFISTVVFAILEPGKSPELATDAHPSEHHGTDGPNAIAVSLFIGAISALGAAYATRKLKYL